MKKFFRLFLLQVGLPVACAATSPLAIITPEANETDKNKMDKNQTFKVSDTPLKQPNKGTKDDLLHQAVVSGVMNNPAVGLGLGLTVIALLGMMRKSYSGDRLGAQRFMQYRILAQFFTMFSLITGVIYFTLKFEKEEKEK